MLNDSVSSDTNIDKVIRNYVNKQKYKDYNITYNNVSISYFSVAKLITIRGVLNGNIQEEHLFAKTLTDSKTRNDRLNLDIKFHREVLMYEKLLPVFQELQKHLKNEDHFRFVKCIEAKDNYIILENLEVLNYKDVSEKKYLDLDHMTLMMKELGKFHGLSFVMKHLSKEKFDSITRKLNDIFFSENRRQELIETIWKYAMSAITSDSIRTKLCTIQNNFLKEAIRGCDLPKNGVICHGDFNIRNVLFKYKNNKPIDLATIDYQLSYYGSPVRDVFFTMASSISEELREKHYEELLNIYYASMGEFLLLHKLNLNEFYSRDDFNNDLKKYFPHAFANCLMILRVMCSPRKSSEDMDKVYDTPQNRGSILIYNSEEAECDYSQRISGLIRHYVNKKYI